MMLKIHSIVKHLLERFLILVEFFLTIRLVLRFFNANADTFIVNLIYGFTNILIWPFNFIFPNVSWQSHYIDVIAITAMVGYIIGFFLILSLLKILWRE